jgi:clusterin-associated protein 1
MKLNIRKLYAADGVAVKELLKLALLLDKATQAASQVEEEVREGSSSSRGKREGSSPFLSGLSGGHTLENVSL